ncbi:cytochrome P450 [Paraburkholderia sp. BR13439]|uniref:cytochrome P450 n=1 Tax=Paraburkholderia sp. BR13439 TaxID=3236996 RepID=UPI0034CDFD0A
MSSTLQIVKPAPEDSVVVARTKDLEDENVQAAHLDGIDLVVIRHAQGVCIYQGRCPHEGTLLSEGALKDDVLTCRGHGWQFACPSGQRRGISTSDLKRFEAIIENGEIKVDRNEVLAWKAQQSSCAAAVEQAARPSPVRSVKQLPGPKGVPLLGNLLDFRTRQLHLLLENWCREFGSMYTYTLMGRRFVAIADPVLVNQVLHDRPGTYRRWDVIQRVAHEMGVDGVFSAEGDTWRRQRQLVVKALDPIHLRAFFPSLRMMTSRLLSRWETVARNRQSVNIRQELMRYTVDVATNLAFGYDMDTLQSDGEIIQQHLAVMFPMIQRRIIAPFPYWHYFKLAPDRQLDRALVAVRALTQVLITRNRARLMQDAITDAPPSNLLEALLTAQEEGEAPLTDEEVMANVFTILLAGEDTTANTIAWIAYLMCTHPEVQNKMQAEVDSVIGEGAILEDADALDDLVYLDAVAKETMRLKPVSPVTSFEPNFDVQLNGIAIPKGTVLTLLTRQPALQPGSVSPMRTFDPDRWLGASGATSSHQVGFVPFGSGPRLCPGRKLALMEVKSALAMMCRNFNISQATDRTAAVDEIFEFTMFPEGLFVRLEQRH